MLLFACKDNKSTTCNVEDPLVELAWLSDIIANFSPPEGSTVYQCTYNNEETGFLIHICGGCLDDPETLYDCKGNIVCYLDGMIEGDCGNIEIKDKELIYSIPW